jgi:A/G-specific adenine glycosylase
MPWRDHPTPYRVWVSEVMLQQTQVATVIPYYRAFIRRLPTVAALARADLHAVLSLWEGLGYYARARNLHRAARLVVARHGGRLPDRAAELTCLPGLGDYAAAAIASIAFGEPVPAVDGNVLRVCARFWGIAEDVRRGAVRRRIRDRLTPLIRRADPSCFNQALMELGALICRPRRPLCGRCPLSPDCVARAADRTAELPVKAPTPRRLPVRDCVAGLVERRGRVLILRRGEERLLGGLWTFPGGRRRPQETRRQAAARAVRGATGLAVRVGAVAATLRHAYSHFRMTLTAFRCALAGAGRRRPARPGRWVRPVALARYPMDRASRRLAGLMARP